MENGANITRPKVNVFDLDNKASFTYIIDGDEAVSNKLTAIIDKMVNNGLNKILPCDLCISILVVRSNFKLPSKYKLRDNELGNNKYVYNLRKGKGEAGAAADIIINSEFYRFTNKLDLNTMLLLTFGEVLGDIVETLFARLTKFDVDAVTHEGLRKFISATIYSMYDLELAENLIFSEGEKTALSGVNTLNWKLPLVTLLSYKISLLDRTRIPKTASLDIITLLSFQMEDDLRKLYSSVLRDRIFNRTAYNSYMLKMASIDSFKDKGDK